MAWEPKYPQFGLVKVDGKNVKVYSSNTSYTTVYVGEPINSAQWAGDVLNVMLASGKARRYKSTSSYDTIY